MTTQAPVFTFRTYNPIECTSTGYDIEFYRLDALVEGFVDYAILTYKTCWQGSVTGTVYRAVPPQDVKRAIRRELDGTDHGHDPDVETAIDDWLSTLAADSSGEPFPSAGWKRIRKGVRIR